MIPIPLAGITMPDVKIPDVGHVCHANVVTRPPDAENSQWEMNEAMAGKQAGTVVRNSVSTKAQNVR